MKVYLKYNVGQEVFFLNEQKRCASAKIECVNVFIYKDHTDVTYNVGGMVGAHEDHIFASRSKLRDYLFPEVIDFK